MFHRETLFGRGILQMTILIERPQDGVWPEFASLAKGQNEKALPDYVRLFDASTPVPNCRAAEMLMAVWAKHQLGKRISTDMTMSGTIGEYAAEWDIKAPDHGSSGWFTDFEPWKKFYGNIHFIGVKRLHPFSPLALVRYVSETIIGARWRRMSETERLLGWPHGEGRVSVVDFLSGLAMTFGDIIQSIPLRKSLGKFPCPACSVTETVYHAVRRTSGSPGFSVTSMRSQHDTWFKCKGAVAWRNQVTSETDLVDLVRTTGLVLNGMAAFIVIDRSLPSDAGVVMRDYSSSRDITKFAHGLWGERLRISTRLTIRDASGNDIGWERFREELEQDSDPFRELIETVPVLSDGRAVSIVI
jgi:hypothetical protein